MMTSSKPETNTFESVVDHEAIREAHIHLKTIVAVAAIDFIVIAQIIAVIGSGLLAQQTAEFLGDSSKASWFSTLLTIFTVALNPPLSQAADFWGRKWIMVICSICGTVGAIIISRAQNMQAIIAGFCVLGLGFGCQFAFYAVPSEVLPRKYRALGQASINVSSGIGAVISLLMGGYLLRNHVLRNYRIYWYVTAGLYAAGTLGIAVGYNPPRRELEFLTTTEKLARLDWIGYLLIAFGLTLFAVGLQWSGTTYSWRDVHVLCPFILGMVMIILFVLYEWFLKRDGIGHHELFKAKGANFPIALISTFAEGLAYFTANAYFVFEVSLVLDIDSFEGSLRFLLFNVCIMVLSFLSGFYTTWKKQIREPIALGFALQLIFNVAMTTFTASTTSAASWGFAVIGGSGIGLVLTIVVVAAQMGTPADMISVTTGLLTSARGVGATVGLVVNNAIFSNSLALNLPTKVAAAVIPLGFPQQEIGVLIGALLSENQAVIEKLPGVTPQVVGAGVAAMKDAYAASFKNAWIAAATFSAAGLIASLFFKNSKNEFNSHIDAPVEGQLITLQVEIEAEQNVAVQLDSKGSAS